MAKNIQSLQLLRNSQIFQDKAAAINGITGSTTQDGVIKLARYTEGDETKTIFGIYHDFGSGNASYTIYDSYQEVIADIQERIADLESGTTEDIEEINKKLGSGVTTANTVTSQLEALSGDSSTAQSGDTSVEGAKKYTDGKIDALDYTDTAVTGNYVSAVDETNGVISVTRVALPSVNAISEAGKPITAVSESLGEISASAGTINAEYVNVADSGNLFSGSTVEAVLAEIDAAYKAADDAIVGDATTSGDTLGKLEDRIEALDADAKEYSIVKTTTGLPETIKESYSLQDASGNTSGATIDIPKDSHIVSINYITTGDHAQNLEYVYIDVSGNTQTTYVDMSELVLETEFASGITVTDHIAHGVVDPTSEANSGGTAFLTVGADGFKVAGIKQEIIDRINELDASVSGGTTAGTATSDHVQVVVDEVDGKLTAVTVSETNIADADDLAELSGKTVTEIASSNNSISATSTAATDGTVSVDLVTDASKIQMSGFTGADVLSGITQASSITEAFLEVDKVITENEETVSAALNDLEETKVENIEVNGVSGTVTDNVASVTIDGADIKLDGYTKASSTGAVAPTDTVNQAIGKLEKGIEQAVEGGLQQVNSGSGVTVSAVANNQQTINVKLADANNITGVAENAIKFNSTDSGLYIDSLDCGTY